MGIIVADSDADGLLSALIVEEKYGYPVIFAESRDPEYLISLLTSEPVVFVDMAPHPRVLKNIGEYVIYDHHRTRKYGENHHNPIFEGIEPPPSCSAYLYKKFGYQGPSWLENLIILSDFIPEVNMEYLGKKKGIREVLGWIWIYARVDLANYYPKHAPHIYSVLKRSLNEGFLPLVEDRTMTELHKSLVEAVSKIAGELARAETGERVVAEVTAGPKLKRKAVNLLWLNHPEKTVIVGMRGGGRVYFSMRSRVEDVSVLAKRAREFGGRGGGHREASGGWVPEERWEDFKSYLLETPLRRS